MLKPSRKLRKLKRLHLLQLLKEIPQGDYCGRCKYKAYTPLTSDYFIYKGILTKEYMEQHKIKRKYFYVNGKYGAETWVKLRYRKVYCKLNRQQSIKDICISEGVKWCMINCYKGENINDK